MGCCHTISSGVAGVTKAVALPQTWAEPEVIEERRRICRSCPMASPCKLAPDKKCWCTVCHCALKLKTKVASEKCPEGKW